MTWTGSRPELKSGVTLGGFVCLAVVLLSGAWALTRPAIESARHSLLLRNLEELLPPGSYDNDPAADRIEVSASALGDDQPHSIYRVRHDKDNTALVIETVAPDGYNGNIRLLLACTRDGRILGVRVTEHRETPGLGDAIEAARSDWIRQFDQTSIAQLPSTVWQRPPDDALEGTPDSRKFDHITGATITSQAVLAAVTRTLVWYKRHAEALFDARPGNPPSNL